MIGLLGMTLGLVSFWGQHKSRPIGIGDICNKLHILTTTKDKTDLFIVNHCRKNIKIAGNLCTMLITVLFVYVLDTMCTVLYVECTRLIANLLNKK